LKKKIKKDKNKPGILYWWRKKEKKQARKDHNKTKI